MTKERVTVNDYARVGEMVKAWASGDLPRPATKGELQKQIEMRTPAGDPPIMVVPDSYKDEVRIIERPADTFCVLLPDPELMQASLDETMEPDAYPLPDFYKLYGFDMLQAIKFVGSAGNYGYTEFHNMRVGDYSTGQCG